MKKKYYLCVADVYYFEVPKADFFECITYINKVMKSEIIKNPCNDKIFYSLVGYGECLLIGFIEDGGEK